MRGRALKKAFITRATFFDDRIGPYILVPSLIICLIIASLVAIEPPPVENSKMNLTFEILLSTNLDVEAFKKSYDKALENSLNILRAGAYYVYPYYLDIIQIIEVLSI